MDHGSQETKPVMSMPERDQISQSNPIPPIGTDRRAWVRLMCALDGSARPLGDRSELAWQVRILDISLGGIALLCSKRFELKTYLMVEREAGSTEQRRMRLARVIHVREAPEGSGWIVGCAFASKLAEEDLRLWCS